MNLTDECPHCGHAIHVMTHDAPCLRAAYRQALLDVKAIVDAELPAEALAIGFVLTGLEFALRKVEAKEGEEAAVEAEITKIPE